LAIIQVASRDQRIVPTATAQAIITEASTSFRLRRLAGKSPTVPRCSTRPTGSFDSTVAIEADDKLFLSILVEREVIIIGGGLSGVGAAVRLQLSGSDDFLLLERAAQLGGTWRDNDYPGCVCDVPAGLYSYSFAPKSDWSRVFAPQDEIRRYIVEIARRHGITDRVRYRAEVESAIWSEETQSWQIRAGGECHSCRVLVSATGPWSEPRTPALPGLSDFAGAVFHSSRWDHRHPIDGARVAVIGTGASAVQIVPAIQPRVAALAVFQRTPHWVLPKPNPKLGPFLRRALGRRGSMRVNRGVLYGGAELLGFCQRNPYLLGPLEAVARFNLRRAVRDPCQRRALTPDFRIGCKQLILSNEWYPALTKPNVRLIPHAASAVRPGGVVDSTGAEWPADTIVLSTGFAVTDPPIAGRLRGRDGRSLAEVWSGSPRSYLGSLVHDFPNLFLLLGPNASNGHSGAAVLAELQINFLLRALRQMRERRLGSIEVSASAQERFNRELERRFGGTVWEAGGCSSYYLDANGRNSVIFPGSTLELRRRLSRFDCDHCITRSLS
jgi:cation diffusion facilitator CzcD-associated flavoprotein CzcO